MTLPQYFELCGYWARKPPLQAMVQAFLKIETRPNHDPLLHEVTAGPSIEELKARFPGGIMMA